MENKLYVVPTPIGNLQDMTFRAIETLKNVDFILAEDTRKTGVLLQHFEIKNKITSYHKFNEHKTVEAVVEKIAAGQCAALVSDAGMPSISDPGFLIVRQCIKNDVEIEVLPGATAFVPALVLSGLPSEKFCFEGFLPVKKGRQKRLNQLKDEERTLIFYESPYRILKTLQQFAEILGNDRRASVSRELTKIYEETIRDSLINLVKIFENKKTIKGEFVIVIEGKNKEN